jgi:hypothetical protein
MQRCPGADRNIFNMASEEEPMQARLCIGMHGEYQRGWEENCVCADARCMARKRP